VALVISEVIGRSGSNSGGTGYLRGYRPQWTPFFLARTGAVDTPTRP